MDDNIINLAVKEILSNNIEEMIKKETFFKEYFRVFYNNKIFNEDTIKSISENIKLDTVNELSEKLIKIFKDKLNILSNLHIENQIGLILFIGDGKIDGHSIIINNYVYVFIDLKALISRSNYNYDLDSFISHEIIHAIHYKLNKAFYNKDYSIMKDIYLKTLIIEGMATYMTMRIFKTSERLGYWLGLMNLEEIEEWKNNCKKLKLNIGKRLNKTIANKKFDKDLYDKLFCIKKGEKLTLYRTGYYYGAEIIKNICIDMSINEIFNINLESIMDYINSYFDRNIF